MIVLVASLSLAGAIGIRSLDGSSPRGASIGSHGVVEKPVFVGSESCKACHIREFGAWRESHHRLAMQPATEAAVLGEFARSKFTDGDVTTTFFREGARFMIRTDGPDGASHDYQVENTFGVSPLQQYMIGLPGGRLQAFSVAWDSRPRAAGGQRWFSLNSHTKASSPLHWTAIDQNWNSMCADCHSTDVRKNYDLATRTYATRYAEIDVGCEACHGPASEHIAWACKRRDLRQFDVNEGLTIALNERRGIRWKIGSPSGDVVRSQPRRSEREIQTCARCHSRRSQISEDYVHGQALGDDYRVALLDPALYFSDGEINGEVYEYGSFIQSRMYRAGVTCSDCHDPHTLKLRAAGNQLCLRCHAAKYDSPRHYFHKAGSPGSQCAQCHMPTRTYMVVDARRDHSLRIPRPALSVELGVPNACNECHRDKAAAWAARTVAKWYGAQPAGFQRFARALYAGSIGAPGALKALAALVANTEQPAIARASALALMAAYPASATAASVRIGVRDPSSMVRRAAARAFADDDSRIRASVLAPLLDDRVRAVRIEAAEVLAGTPADALPRDSAAALATAINEYVAALELNADRPESHLDLASLFASERRITQAASELKIALSLDPTFTPAAVNLADLERELGRDDEGEHVLRDAIARSPKEASLQYSLGLLLIRRGHTAEALDHLAGAARFDPADARFAFVYAVALNDNGHTDEAIKVLESNVERHPYDRDSLAALANLYRRAGNRAKGAAYANRVAELKSDGAQPQ